MRICDGSAVEIGRGHSLWIYMRGTTGDGVTRMCRTPCYPPAVTAASRSLDLP